MTLFNLFCTYRKCCFKALKYRKQNIYNNEKKQISEKYMKSCYKSIHSYIICCRSGESVNHSQNGFFFVFRCFSVTYPSHFKSINYVLLRWLSSGTCGRRLSLD